MKKYYILLAAVLFTAVLSAQNVGINTNTPQATLDVNGTLKVGALTGATDQMVVSDANGNISVMPLPAPDQIVNLTGGGGTTISGTYPNFTISSTDNVDDADADPANEIQNLSLTGNTLGISSGNSIDLSPIIPATVWTASGSDALYNSGNVGVGNTNPSALVDIRTPLDSSAMVGTDVDISNLSLILSKESNSTASNGVGIGFASSSNFATTLDLNIGGAMIFERTGGGSVGGLHFATKGAVVGGGDIPIRMSIASGGNVGIGTTTPSEKLHVDGNIRVADDADIFGVDVIQGFNDLRFQGDGIGGDDFRIQASGLSGIGGVSPNVALDVNNFSSNSAGAIFVATNAAGGDKFQVWDNGDVFAIGNFTVTSGTKNFMLDHPLDPSNKNLYHNAVESPDHVTYYHGTVVLDANGAGVVALPDYFQALNKDFHYQLTCVGGFAQVYVSEEITNNQFKIAGGTSGLKVSWQVSATRNDPWVQDHPYQAEVEKKPEHKGKYWYPEGYGKSQSFQIGFHPEEDARND